jgi:hypothetical protein
LFFKQFAECVHTKRSLIFLNWYRPYLPLIAEATELNLDGRPERIRRFSLAIRLPSQMSNVGQRDL